MSAAVIGPSAEMFSGYGDSEMCSYIRSAAKPFQLLSALQVGLQTEFGLSDEEIAVCCSSHSGEEMHVEAVESILEKTGLDSSLLGCGVHPPLGKEVRQRMNKEGSAPTVLHNNCSGKHSAMLATAKIMGEPLDDYLNPAHPVQQRILELIKKYSEEDEIRIGVDGCSAPVFYLAIEKMALMYRKLAESEEGSLSKDIWKKMTSYPLMVAGTGRFDTLLMTSGEGIILSKMGAEGVQCIAIKAADGPIGIALKVHDGSRRVIAPAVFYILDKMGVTPEGDFDRLRRPVLKNHVGTEVGWIEVSDSNEENC